MPRVPTCSRLALMSSSVNGFTIAVISFISSSLFSRMDNNRTGADNRELIAALSVLRLVDARGFVFGVQTQPDGVLQKQSYDKCADARVREHARRADGLPDQLSEAAAVEQPRRRMTSATGNRDGLRGRQQAHQQGAREPSDQVDPDHVQRVVESELELQTDRQST